MRTTHVLAAAFALLFASTSTAFAQETLPVYGWTEGDSEPLELEDLQPDPNPEPYFENWDFWLWADDGTFIFVQFLASSISFGNPRRGSARILMVEPNAVNTGDDDDGVFRGDRGFQGVDGDWGWNEPPLDIYWRDCVIAGDGENFQLYVRGGDRTLWLDIEMTAEAPVSRPGDGHAEYGWDRHTQVELQALPRFSFEGRINQKEDRDAPDNWVPIQGVGAMEHARINAFPYEVAQSFRRFRAMRDDGLTINFHELETPGEHDGVTLGWLQVILDEQVVFETNDAEMAVGQRVVMEGLGNEYAVPMTYQIRATDGADQVQITVTDSELVSSESPLRQLSTMLRAFLGGLMSPNDFELTNRYEAYMLVDGDTAFVGGFGWSTFNFTLGL